MNDSAQMPTREKPALCKTTIVIWCNEDDDVTDITRQVVERCEELGVFVMPVSSEMANDDDKDWDNALVDYFTLNGLEGELDETICAHRVHYRYDTEQRHLSEVQEACLVEHVRLRARQMIKQEYQQGDLCCTVVDECDNELEFRGWWKIVAA